MTIILAIIKELKNLMNYFKRLTKGIIYKGILRCDSTKEENFKYIG